jgi:hypothetical protein
MITCAAKEDLPQSRKSKEGRKKRAGGAKLPTKNG